MTQNTNESLKTKRIEILDKNFENLLDVPTTTGTNKSERGTSGNWWDVTRRWGVHHGGGPAVHRRRSLRILFVYIL